MTGLDNKRMDHVVLPEEEGRRVRDILRRSMGVSYSALKSAKWDGRIFLNGENVLTDAKVREGDTVSILWPQPTPVYQPRKYRIPLDIRYEDGHLIILNKPAPLASQSSRNHPDDSLENAVYTYLGCPEGFIYRPVNRLDRGTSGLMAIARTPHAQFQAQQQLHTPRFRRRYLAMTDGIPEKRTGVIDMPIGKVPGATVKRTIDPDGKRSVTRYRVLQDDGKHALMLLELETGRTHQIRVHLSEIGCPVRGDFLYGTEQPDAFPGRFALHSAMLEMEHPITGKPLCFISLPEWAGPLGTDVLFMDFD